MRQAFLWTLCVASALTAIATPAQAQGIVTQTAAARHGLHRAWFAQLGSPQVTGQIEYLNYVDGLVLAQSSLGMLTCLDGETGRTLWQTRVGTSPGASSEPAANSQYVVVLNGSTLYVIRRSDGSIAWKKRVGSAPGAGPGVTDTHVFVPMVSGLIEGYELAAGALQTPWNYKSTGRVLTPPMTTPLTVSWTTDHGYFYVADPNAKGIKYRLESGGAIHARPAAWSPLLFATSIDGFVYAIDEAKGSIKWKQLIGEQIYERPVAVTGAVLVIPEFGGMYCLDPGDGSIRWHVPGIKQFVAASPTRIYAANSVGALEILDAATGASAGTLALSSLTKKHVNSRSDRIYLVDDNCLLQCLHETQLTEPALHIPPVQSNDKAPAPTDRPAEPADADQPTADAPAAVDNPFGGAAPADPPAAADDNPFGTPGDAPASDNPFGAPGDAGNPFGTP